MADFTTDFGSFADTQITVSAVSAAALALLGEMFGQGACSVVLPKSQGPAFAEYVETRGFSIL